MLFASPITLGLGLSEGKDMVSRAADVDSIYYSCSHITGSKKSDDKLCGMLVKYSSRVIPRSRSESHLGKDDVSQEISLPVAHAINNIPVVTARPTGYILGPRATASAPPQEETNHDTRDKKHEGHGREVRK